MMMKMMTILFEILATVIYVVMRRRDCGGESNTRDVDVGGGLAECDDDDDDDEDCEEDDEFSEEDKSTESERARCARAMSAIHDSIRIQVMMVFCFNFIPS